MMPISCPDIVFPPRTFPINDAPRKAAKQYFSEEAWAERRSLDKGCNLAPSCLACPFERCKYDTPGSPRAELRNAEIRDAIKRGVPAPEIISSFKISRRTLSRIVSTKQLSPA